MTCPWGVRFKGFELTLRVWVDVRDDGPTVFFFVAPIPEASPPVQQSATRAVGPPLATPAQPESIDHGSQWVIASASGPVGSVPVAIDVEKSSFPSVAES